MLSMLGPHWFYIEALHVVIQNVLFNIRCWVPLMHLHDRDGSKSHWFNLSD